MPGRVRGMAILAHPTRIGVGGGGLAQCIALRAPARFGVTALLLLDLGQ